MGAMFLLSLTVRQMIYSRVQRLTETLSIFAQSMLPK